MDPDNLDFWYHRGYAWRYLGQEDKAIQHYRHILKKDPEYADAWFNLAESQLALEKKEPAKSLQRYLEIGDHPERLEAARIALEEHKEQEK